MATDTKRLRAVQMLVLGNACWALSFPTMKAVGSLHESILPDISSWYVAASTLMLRFGIAALVMLVVSARTLRNLTGLEVWQGLVLGLFASAGLMFQMDGLAYTSASTSAFLTQFYCLLIPVFVACRTRRWPSPTVVVSCLLVIAGVGVLSEINWQTMRMGRGELETLVGSTIFTGQILWLQRSKFSHNNVNHFTLVMFAVIALTCLPMAAMTGPENSDWTVAYQSMPMVLMMGILTGFCTLAGYLLMNYWQPFLTATQAGLVYCLEPVFASLFALFLPGWLSILAGINYQNETIGIGLVVGGGLITVANALIQLQPAPVIEPELPTAPTAPSRITSQPGA
jgi:drug/metabolite transporter (DMT)-like permease